MLQHTEGSQCSSHNNKQRPAYDYMKLKFDQEDHKMRAFRMNNMPHKDINLWEIIIYAILAIFGSIARISSDYIQGKKTSLIELICKIIISLFAAVIVYLTCKYFELDALIVAISSSLSGWMGTEIVSVFAHRLKREIEGKL